MVDANQVEPAGPYRLAMDRGGISSDPCPACLRANRNRVLWCACGFDFVTGELHRARVGVRVRARMATRGMLISGALCVALLLLAHWQPNGAAWPPAAEEVGFEPTAPFQTHAISSRAH